MHFRIAAEELSRALHRASGIVDRKTTMPILANVLIRATQQGVSVTAFDLDIGVVSEHPAEVMTEGSITLSAATGTTAPNLSAAGALNLSAANGVTINHNLTAVGLLDINADNDASGAGTLTISSGRRRPRAQATTS